MGKNQEPQGSAKGIRVIGRATKKRWEFPDGMVERVRERGPLVHCITNYVTVESCANILLAAGASPIMADDSGEMEEIIPDGEMTYYFKWDNFGLCRYDVASVFQLSGGGGNYEFDVTEASETKIPLVYRTDSKEYTLNLVKEG